MGIRDSSLSAEVIIPDFLILHPTEEQLVVRYAPYLAVRAHEFSHTFYQHVLQESEVSSALTGHDIELLMKNMVKHYRNILLHDYDASMRNILHHVGKAHQRIGLPMHWLVATYSLSPSARTERASEERRGPHNPPPREKRRHGIGTCADSMAALGLRRASGRQCPNWERRLLTK